MLTCTMQVSIDRDILKRVKRVLVVELKMPTKDKPVPMVSWGFLSLIF